jgi:uncharacterized circularly permuted ATP-grasp superfamily protein/uncharacterized alpha-E superfamily protein
VSTVETEGSVWAHLLEGYRPAEGAFDELVDSDSQVRSHWQPLLKSLGRISKEDLAARREATRRVLREHGATYNVYSDSRGLDRPWELDLMPLLISPAEWRQLEAGLAQRAQLFNLLLADIYGPQRVLKEGLLPPALLFANPAFLRPCHGTQPIKNTFLSFYASDLARSPDGKWWVLSDRTQAPSGAGYALENRLVLSRVFPDEYRESHVHRLAGFFQTFRDTLRGLAPAHQDRPTVVLLTPGPYNETYFEQSFLARYLGFPLVEGGDLTVRDRRVFIKTLEGLQPLDVILRRIDDTFCDPLELRADSSLGVPGLMEAARAGNVAVANAFGSGVVEMPALMAFLPGLCRHFLGQELLLPSVGTWWCGQEKEFDYVCEHIRELDVKSAFAALAGEASLEMGLKQEERPTLLGALRNAPYNFIGQERVTFSSAPVLENGRLEPRPMVLRACVCASAQGYSVMPGGLTRFSSTPDRLAVSMQSGGGSKDTWVLADGPVSTLTLLKPSAQFVRLERAAAEVPSRVADNLFWLGRYVERLEDTVRLLRCLLGRLVGETGAEETPELSALIQLLVNLDLLPARFRGNHSLAAVERELNLLIYQTHRLGTVREICARLRGLAFVLRDRFSADTWTILNRLQVDSRNRHARGQTSDSVALLNSLVTDLAAFSGMEMENMTRGHGWRFLDVGRRLERGINIITLVQGALSLESNELAVLEPVLEIADSVMTYRRRYFAQPQWPAVLDLLLADDTNPRSLAFQLGALAGHAANLPRDNSMPGIEHPSVQIERLQGELQEPDWQALLAKSVEDTGQSLKALLLRLVSGLRFTSDSITHLYFSHADTRAS